MTIHVVQKPVAETPLTQVIPKANTDSVGRVENVEESLDQGCWGIFSVATMSIFICQPPSRCEA